MKYINQTELCKQAGIPFYTVDYLVRTNKIQAKQFGKGVPRQFPPDTIQKINEILALRDGRACRVA